jgi:hypothetical protein
MHELRREMDENLIALGLDAENVDAPKWEIYEWRSVIDLARLVQETLNTFAKGYMQYVSIEEAHVSNENAMDLSKITVLTMFSIPLSAVASISSMGEGFLPGGIESWCSGLLQFQFLPCFPVRTGTDRLQKLSESDQGNLAVIQHFQGRHIRGLICGVGAVRSIYLTSGQPSADSLDLYVLSFVCTTVITVSVLLVISITDGLVDMQNLRFLCTLKSP